MQSATFFRLTMIPPLIPAQIMIPPPLLCWWRFHPFTKYPLLQPSRSSVIARNSFVNKTFKKPTFMFSSSYFDAFVRVFLSMKVLSLFSLMSRPFFRKWHRTVLNTVVSLKHLKSSPLIRWYLPIILSISNVGLLFVRAYVIADFSHIQLLSLFCENLVEIYL